MQQVKRRGFLYGLVLITALFPFVPASVARAAGETAYLTPASGTTQTGKTFTLSVDGYVGQSWWFWVPIGASSVEGSIAFPSKLLKVTSINTSGAAFPNGSITPNNTTGKINFSGSTSSGSYMNTTVHLFSVTFQAIAPGNANVTFESVEYNIGAANTTGGAYTINSPPPPSPSPTPPPKPKPKPKPQPSSTPIPVATPSPSPSPEPEPEVTEEEIIEPETDSEGGLLVEAVTVIANRQENRVIWTVNDPSIEPIFLYGEKKSEQTQTATPVKAEDGSFGVDLTELKLGTLYHFTIKATSEDNLQEATYNGTLTTRGFPVQLTIKQNNLLAPGAKVEINGRTFVTNDSGIIAAEFPEGQHTATITPRDSSKSYTVTFTVATKEVPESGNPDTQKFDLNIEALGKSGGGTGSLILPIIGIALAVFVTIAGIIIFLVMRKRNAPQNGAESYDSDLLSSSYGTTLDARRHTPEPQLGAMSAEALAPIGNTQPLPEQPTAPPQPASQAPIVAPQLIENQYAVPVVQQPATGIETAGSGEPADIWAAPPNPVPELGGTVPATSAPTNDTSVTQPSPQTQEYTPEEQFAPELMQVEAQGLAAAQPPDDQTGELSISHHGPRSTNLGPPMAVQQ